jgi:hypothetical protein
MTEARNMDTNSTAHDIEISKLGAMMRMQLHVFLAWKHFSIKLYGKGDNLEAILCDGSMEFRVHLCNLGCIFNLRWKHRISKRENCYNFTANLSVLLLGCSVYSKHCRMH